MILQKTGLQEIPKSCLDCTVSCRLPAKKSSYDYVLKKEFFNKRHEDCPLVFKAEIIQEFTDKLIDYFIIHGSEVYNHVCARDFICDKIIKLAEKEQGE